MFNHQLLTITQRSRKIIWQHQVTVFSLFTFSFIFFPCMFPLAFLLSVKIEFYTYKKIVNSYFLHYNIKSQRSFMSSEIKINLNEKRSFYSYGNCFLYIPSAWPQEPTLCQFLGIIDLTYIGVCRAFPYLSNFVKSREMFSGRKMQCKNNQSYNAKRISLTWFFATLPI